jgi:hypothetical protein
MVPFKKPQSNSIFKSTSKHSPSELFLFLRPLHPARNIRHSPTLTKGGQGKFSQRHVPFPFSVIPMVCGRNLSPLRPSYHPSWHCHPEAPEGSRLAVASSTWAQILRLRLRMTAYVSRHPSSFSDRSPPTTCGDDEKWCHARHSSSGIHLTS